MSDIQIHSLLSPTGNCTICIRMPFEKCELNPELGRQAVLCPLTDMCHETIEVFFSRTAIAEFVIAHEISYRFRYNQSQLFLTADFSLVNVRVYESNARKSAGHHWLGVPFGFKTICSLSPRLSVSIGALFRLASLSRRAYFSFQISILLAKILTNSGGHRALCSVARGCLVPVLQAIVRCGPWIGLSLHLWPEVQLHFLFLRRWMLYDITSTPV